MQIIIGDEKLSSIVMELTVPTSVVVLVELELVEALAVVSGVVLEV